jgi:hypothetical protein
MTPIKVYVVTIDGEPASTSVFETRAAARLDARLFEYEGGPHSVRVTPCMLVPIEPKKRRAKR